LRCSICEGTEFVPGFNGRMTFGMAPACAGCGSVERHRIVHDLFSALTPMLKTWRVLQFAPDRSVRQHWFALYTGSVYGGQNSLNMMDTGLEQGSFDLVLSNHVLEHVEDDIGAIREMLRVVGPSGLVALTVPTPLFRWSTEDWHFADAARNYHFRDYGADFASNVVNTIPGARAMIAIGRDAITGIADHVYFLSLSRERLAGLARIWQPSGIPLVNIHRS